MDCCLVRPDRLLDKFIVGDGCWEWTGGRDTLGYGQLNGTVKEGTKGLTFRAHRVVYELLVGPIPEGLTIDHLCHNRGCVRPAHLEPVTHQENCKRRSSHSATRFPAP